MQIKHGSQQNSAMNQAHRRFAPTGAQGENPAHPGMWIPGYHRAGFSLLELMIVVSLVGLLAVIAIPNFLASRQAAQRGACIHNLRQIDAAIQTWAMETQKSVDATVAATDIVPYLKYPVVCPAGGEPGHCSTSLTESPRTEWFLVCIIPLT